ENFQSKTRARMDMRESHQGNRFRQMVMAFTTWRETCGTGAAIGIALIITRRWPIKAAWRTIHKARIHHLILPSQTKRNGCIAAALSSSTINIAHATSLAPAAKARSTPVQITSVFDASNRRRTLRNAQRRIDFPDEEVTIGKSDSN